MARRAPIHELPEIELLPLEGDGLDEGDAAEDPARPGRSQSVHLFGALLGGLAVVLLTALLTGREEPPVEVLPTPPTTIAPTTTIQRLSMAAVSVTLAPDGQRLSVTSRQWTGTIDVAPEMGRITSVAAGRGFVVVTLTSGEARRYSIRDAEGTPVGTADLVLADGDDTRVVWTVRSVEARQVIRSVVGPWNEGGKTYLVPEGWRVVGASGRGLVLSGVDSGVGVAIWDPGAGRPPAVLDSDGLYLASSPRTVAWSRYGRVLLSAGPFNEPRVVPIEGDVIAALFSPDNRYLALIGPDVTDSAWTVRVVDRNRELAEQFVVPGTQPPFFGWDPTGELVVGVGMPVEYRYDPDLDRVTTTERIATG